VTLLIECIILHFIVHDVTVAPETWAVVAGRGGQTPGSPLNVPPVLASNFVLGGDRAYTRDDGTATWEAFEEILGGLEHGVAVAFASGMAAAAAIFDLLPANAELVLPDDCYQAVVGLAEAGRVLGRWSFMRLAPDDTDGWLQAAAHADLLWLESPSNPLLHVADLPEILSQPRKPGAITVVDNTFATPLGQQPLEFGADLVLHSATKFLGGHSDLMLGAAVGSDDDLAGRLRERRLLAGAIPGSLETYLAVRGMRTLHLRFERATATAHELATRLERHTDVSTVRYPGLPTHPTHSTARRFMRSYGAMISFDIHGDAGRADAICESLQIIRHATSLGSVESTIERRAAVPGQEHLPPTLLRLSVGCENVEDLWSDLESALARSRPTARA
jgi:cystathionine gamma-synthase